MSKNFYDELSRLERRIMDTVFRLGQGSVADVVKSLGDEDIYHSIRVTMANLEKKGFLKHHREGTRNIYTPALREGRARKSAMDHLVRTFFDGSPAHALLGFLDRYETKLNRKEIAEIRAMIEAAERANPKR